MRRHHDRTSPRRALDATFTRWNLRRSSLSSRNGTAASTCRPHRHATRSSSIWSIACTSFRTCTARVACSTSAPAAAFRSSWRRSVRRTSRSRRSSRFTRNTRSSAPLRASSGSPTSIRFAQRLEDHEPRDYDAAMSRATFDSALTGFETGNQAHVRLGAASRSASRPCHATIFRQATSATPIHRRQAKGRSCCSTADARAAPVFRHRARP